MFNLVVVAWNKLIGKKSDDLMNMCKYITLRRHEIKLLKLDCYFSLILVIKWVNQIKAEEFPSFNTQELYCNYWNR